MFVHRAKLRPPQISHGSIQRGRLERHLAGACVVSIVAAPGYGKTTLAASYCAQWSGPTFWYSLDSADSDLPVFAAHVAAGLRACGLSLPRFSADDVSSLGSPKEVGLRFAEALTDAQPRALLIFDDVHALQGSRALPALTELVERGCRLGARFVLCGRWMPVPLHRIAAAGELRSVGASQLAFDSSETEQYLKSMLDGLADRSVALDLAQRAEGWAAGLTLIASSGAGRKASAPAQPVKGAGDSARAYLFDYLASEVFDGLSEPDRRFLVDTSILDRLDVPACDAVTQSGFSGNQLESLAGRGIFIAKLSEDSYACHQLFREFLSQALVRDKQPEDIKILHRRAAAFFQSRSDWVRVIEHSLGAMDLASAVMVLERQIFALLRAGLIAAVEGFLGRLGDELVSANAAFLAAKGRVQRERGDWDGALASLERAVSLAKTAGDAVILAEAVRFASPILASRNELKRLQSMLQQALRSSADLPQESVDGLRMNLAAVHLEDDRLDEAIAMYRTLSPALAARGDLAAQGLVLHNMGVAHMRHGDVYAGLTMYERALKLKEDAGQRLSVLHTKGDLVYVKTLVGDLQEADRLAEDILSQGLYLGAASVVARAHEQRGTLALLRDDAHAAAEAFAAAEKACDPGDVLLLPYIEHGLAQCARLRGDAHEADFRSTRALTTFQRAGRQQECAPVLLTQACCALLREEWSAAASLAVNAIDAAAKGPNLLTEAVCGLEAADVLAACAIRTAEGEASLLDRRAAAAASHAVGLLHQRRYQFLLRTKAKLFERLQPHFTRWSIGQGLLPQPHAGAHVRSLRVEMLGPFKVFLNDRLVTADAWKRRRAPEILAFLVANKGRVVPRSRLADLYWPESDADAAHNSLRVTVTAIRKVIGDLIRYEAKGYRFESSSEVVIDVDLFAGHLETARQAESRGDAPKARSEYYAAASLYRGEYLEGFSDAGWEWRERERRVAEYLEALRWLVKDRLLDGDTVAHRSLLERLLETAPFDLEAVKARLDALVSEDRLIEAKKAYAAWRVSYKRAVGSEAPEIWDPARSSRAAPATVSLSGK